ncbi:UNVERIFIED_CONTAM: hypothetical protein K2H54_026681 [Gekko kuhli]
MNGLPVEFKLDLGAAVTAIPLSVSQKYPKQCLLEPVKYLKGPSLEHICTAGRFNANLQYNGKEISEIVYVKWTSLPNLPPTAHILIPSSPAGYQAKPAYNFWEDVVIFVHSLLQQETYSCS